MKKIALFFLSLILVYGCSKQKELDPEVDFYLYTKQQLLEKETYDKAEFRIQLVYNEIENGYRYDIIIDQPLIDMYYIKAMCYNEETDDEICPSIGFFDSESFHIKRDYIDKESGYYKGIQLSGTCQKKNDVLLYICYYTDENQTNRIEKYIKVVST